MKPKNKGVYFNLDDPRQQKLFERACQQYNFSDYVKGLIQKDIDGSASKPIPIPVVKKQVLAPVTKEPETSQEVGLTKNSAMNFI